MTTHPLTPHFGIEIGSLDLARLKDAGAAEVLRLIEAHGVVIVRGQQLTLQQFDAFSRKLGPLAMHGYPHCAAPGHPEVLIQSNILQDGQPIGYPDATRQWQSIGAHLKTPHRTTISYAVEVPVQDGVTRGDTTFADTRAAYDALEPALRQQLDAMRAAHVDSTRIRKRFTPYFPDSGLTQIFKRGVEHAMARRHPRTRRKCLYVNPLTTTQISGMNPQDSAALLAQLFQHLAQPAFTYRHRWQAGDMVMWDNCAVQFRTEADYALPLRRLIYRAVIRSTPD